MAKKKKAEAVDHRTSLLGFVWQNEEGGECTNPVRVKLGGLHPVDLLLAQTPNGAWAYGMELQTDKLDKNDLDKLQVRERLKAWVWPDVVDQAVEYAAGALGESWEKIKADIKARLVALSNDPGDLHDLTTEFFPATADGSPAPDAVPTENGSEVEAPEEIDVDGWKWRLDGERAECLNPADLTVVRHGVTVQLCVAKRGAGRWVHCVDTITPDEGPLKLICHPHDCSAEDSLIAARQAYEMALLAIRNDTFSAKDRLALKEFESPKLGKEIVQRLVALCDQGANRQPVTLADPYAQEVHPVQEEKRENRLLRVNLTKEELLAAGKDQADKFIQIAALEEDKKRVTDDFKAKTSALEAEVQVLSNRISSGYDHRNVECVVYLAHPKPTQKTIIRLDTQEVVGIEDMTKAELQRELDLEKTTV